MKLKNEKYGDFIIEFYGDEIITAEARFQGARAAVTTGRTKEIAFDNIKKILDQKYPLQVPNSSDYFLGPNPRKHKDYNFYRGKK